MLLGEVSENIVSETETGKSASKDVEHNLTLKAFLKTLFSN